MSISVELVFYNIDSVQYTEPNNDCSSIILLADVSISNTFWKGYFSVSVCVLSSFDFTSSRCLSIYVKYRRTQFMYAAVTW